MKQCLICRKNLQEIDFKNIELLKRFLTPHGKIIAARKSGLCAKHQRQVARAIKRARQMALLPFGK